MNRKKLPLLATKLIKKHLIRVIIKNTINFIWKQKQKIGETIKRVTQRPKTMEKPSLVDIKSVNIENSRTPNKLPSV